MKIVCIGAGPAGLYFAISMKLRDPNHDITVIERNQPDSTFGWGVVFSDETMDNLRRNDPMSADVILDNFAHWDDIDVHIKGEVITSSGHGFCGISRMRLLNLLHDRARELGVKLEFGVEFELDDIDTKYKDADLVIASDGLNSKIRNGNIETFDAEVDMRANKFVWLGTHKIFDAFTFIFKETEHGWIWVHAYRFDKDTSTFIVECQPHVYDAFGFANMSQEENCRFLEELFAEYLDGNSLMTNAKHIRGSAWINFPRVVCGNWRNGRVVLLGDAAHTAHFSIGSGTKLGFEDAIKLADVLHSDMPLDEALSHYQEVRHIEVLKIQNAARNSMEWFEQIDRYLKMEPQQFTYSLLTRSQRVSHENLRKRDSEWLEGYEQWFAEQASGHPIQQRTPPMFTPFKLRDMELKNRVAMSPMCMYSAVDGTPNDFHVTHYTSRALGGAALVYTEMTNVSADGRITPGCTGIYSDDHIPAWKRIVDYVHERTDAKIALQLGHAGRKGSTKVIWEGFDQPLDEGNWEVIGPSAIPWSPINQTPRAMTRDDMDRVKADYVSAVARAEQCGFDMLEFHAGHGYLMSSFITPISNKREDEYGGSLENRLRFPLEVFRAVRAAWPQHKPMSVRISAHDWMGDEGITDVDAVEIARAFTDAGADIIDVSSGQTSKTEKPVYGRMFQTPFSDRIRNEAGISTLAVGNIFEIDHVNSILAAGRADMCCLARSHLFEPFWTLKAAIQQNYRGVRVPSPYISGFMQYERLLERGVV